MSQRLLFIFCLLLVPIIPLWAATPLPAALDKILNAPALRGGVTGAVVERVGDRKTLYARNPDLRLLPASNRKLFTSAAALELFGDKFTLTTKILAAAKPDQDGVVQGDLLIKGVGDSTLTTADFDTLARTLAKKAITRITGDIVGDGSAFTGEPYGFGWEWDDFSDEEFPQISGLEVNEGVVTLTITGGKKAGDKLAVTLDPITDYVPVTNLAQTVAKGVPKTCTVVHPYGRNALVVTGSLPIGSVVQIKVPVENPSLYAATLFRNALVRAGITVSGKPTTEPLPLLPALTLASHTSVPLSQIIALMNKPSDNLLAESLVREIGIVKGKNGSYEAGDAIEMPFFRSIGVDTTPLALVDGCGVGRRNFVTARAVAQLLVGMRAKRDWKIYYDSLPIAGVDGTLKSRMKGTKAAGNVHAKTGTLSQARALSGYVTGTHGGLYAFSLLMNNFPGKAKSAGDVQDAFVEYLARTLP